MVAPSHEAGARSFSRFNHDEPPFNPDVFLITDEIVSNYLMPNIVFDHPEDEPDNPGCHFFRPSHINVDLMFSEMEGTSSPGYPYNKVYRMKRMCYRELHDEVLQYCSDFFDGFSVEPPIWALSVKTNEIRRKAKVDAGDLRTFLAPPLPFLTLQQLLCYDFNRRFYRLFGKIWSALGMTMYDRGWDKLFKRLSRFPRGWSLDAKGFDATIARRVFEWIAELRWRCLRKSLRTQHNRFLLHRLYAHIVDSLVVTTLGDLFLKCTGNPSGSFNTAVDNTLAMIFYMVYCWVALCIKNDEFAKVRDVFAYVEAAIYGDDNTFTVDEKSVPWFNAKSVAIEMKTIGITVTGDVTPAKVEDLTFLSCGFLKYQRWMVPRVNSDKMLCVLRYHTSRPKDILLSYQRACALAVLCYFDANYTTIMNYISWLIVNFSSELDSAANSAGINWRSCRLLPDAIERLYLG